jgi:hypothetical protein
MRAIIDIYVSKKIQWYKKNFNQISFDPYNRPLKIRKSIEILIPITTKCVPVRQVISLNFEWIH